MMQIIFNINQIIPEQLISFKYLPYYTLLKFSY